VLKRWGETVSELNNTIKNCNETIAILDVLEERRQLFRQEFTFRNILKRHLMMLLERKRIFWRQRYTVRWTKFSDENTNFFHAATTERYRINTIMSLQNEDDNLITDHNAKAGMIWEEYKERMGQTLDPEMLFHLPSLIDSHIIDGLPDHYTHEDIDKVVKGMPMHKAPGPDGFNGEFYKKCWNIIKFDIYQLCDVFFQGTTSLQPINNSYITLIPNINNPTRINDFRPITLSNTAVKIITKLLGNNLQSQVIPLIHENQYGFIKSRTIQDCLAWAFEYIHQWHKSKQECIILKLDFTKAFDTIEHNAILKVMSQMGFPQNWIRWITVIFETETTSILLNGVPGKPLHQRRGVRQGDPLSPLLFVLGADLLQIIVIKAFQQGLLHLPLPARDGAGFLIV
jgi:hypothetical protein